MPKKTTKYPSNEGRLMIALSSVGAALLEENLQLLSERVRGVGSSYKGSVTSKKTCVELALETHNRILKGEEV